MKQCIYSVFIVSCILLSCNASHDKSDVETYYHKLTSDLKKLDIQDIHILGFDRTNIAHPMYPTIDSNGNYIIVDGVTWTINLIAPNGTLLSQVGGIGRGPGEFMGINQIIVDNSSTLRVLDLSQSRVTYFNIFSNKIVLSEVKIINTTNSGGRIRSIHSIDGRLWGVFATNQPSLSLSFFELDDNYNPLETNVQVPVHHPNILLQNRTNNVRWATSQSTLSYIYFDSLSVYKYDVTTNTLSRYPILSEHFDRNPDSDNLEYISQEYSHIQVTENNVKLPQLTYVGGYGDRVVVSLLYLGGDHTLLYLFDLNDLCYKYIKAPPAFFLHNIFENKITGVVKGEVVTITF
ncbi:MAG: 6-bladed beta-propeller [Balneolales bacterium]|nr:6-bladed beta-propeller [Balneolales bacterium]